MDRRLSTTVAGTACSLLLGACTLAGPSEVYGSRAAGLPPTLASVRAAEAQMPRAPHDRAAWLRAVDRAYATAAGGLGAEQWLRRRAERRRPGERLAVVMGVDDVLVQSDFAGSGALVPRSVRFAKTAHALGYAVFFVTGRSYADGLGRIEALISRAGVAAAWFCPPPTGVSDEATAKARCRAAIRADGYTLAMSVAADGAGLVGEPEAEQVVRLPQFFPSP